MREWTIKEQIPTWTQSPPGWLLQPWRSWDHPQGPILLTGRVKAGREDEARVAVLGMWAAPTCLPEDAQTNVKGQIVDGDVLP